MKIIVYNRSYEQYLKCPSCNQITDSEIPDDYHLDNAWIVCENCWERYLLCYACAHHDYLPCGEAPRTARYNGCSEKHDGIDSSVLSEINKKYNKNYDSDKWITMTISVLKITHAQKYEAPTRDKNFNETEYFNNVDKLEYITITPPTYNLRDIPTMTECYFSYKAYCENCGENYNSTIWDD